MPDSNIMSYTDAAVIPLQSFGIIDAGASYVGENEMLSHALTNASSGDLENGYLVKRSSSFMNEYGRTNDAGEFTDGGPDNPNHMMGTFVTLWPYGVGGIETRRPI